MIELDVDQKRIHDAAVTFARQGDGYLTIGGYAGTGKTTVTAAIVKTLRRCLDGVEIAFCCYTGKAASVLRGKLEAADALRGKEHCGTIHSLIYAPIIENDVIIGWKRVDRLSADLIIVDEASMVNQTIWDDLRSYRRPILAIGDHGQLPPIEGAFNLMSSPHYRLVKIHRQAESNPIIRLSMLAREEGNIPFGEHGPGVSKIVGTPATITDAVKDLRGTLFLCGLNRTRQVVNSLIRKRLGYEGNPKPGEKVICLKNNREAQIYNGVGGTLEYFMAMDDNLWAEAKVRMETGNLYNGLVIVPQFGAETTIKTHSDIRPKELRDLFDFGYCITVHKAQGSEADSVVVFEERFSHMDDAQWRKWLYTAVTRAKSKLVVAARRN